ncbi:MAG: VirB3 family type IV secretion system protein [Rickettsiales endosymbiont of Dermacentor nuttalli]
MASTGKLQADPLFVGLTRPTMFLGVSFPFVILYSLGCMMYFINSSDLRTFIAIPMFHLVGYIICFKEPLFMELFILRSQKCTYCKNKLFHGANSYDAY